MPEAKKPGEEVLAEPGVEERIIQATIECIEEVGVQAVTVRRIALEAGVNIAAINYYFRSKERLFEIVLERTFAEATSKAIEELDQYIGELGSTKEGLLRLLREQAAGMAAYPRLSHWHLERLLESGRRGEAIPAWDRYLEALLERLRPILPDGEEADVRASVVQLYGALFLSGIYEPVFAGFTALDLTDAEDRDRFINRLLEHFLR